jgi:hypothetical protein
VSAFEETVHLIGLAFAISTLYVLVHPKFEEKCFPGNIHVSHLGQVSISSTTFVDNFLIKAYLFYSFLVFLFTK